jgi:hypothetical protein
LFLAPTSAGAQVKKAVRAGSAAAPPWMEKGACVVVLTNSGYGMMSCRSSSSPDGWSAPAPYPGNMANARARAVDVVIVDIVPPEPAHPFAACGK